MNNQEFSTSAPTNIQISQSLPGAPTFIDPLIGIQPNSQGDTVYWLLDRIFSPRVMFSTTPNYSTGLVTITNRYSGISPLYKTYELVRGILMRAIFAKRPGRSQPSDAIFDDMIACIEDIQRMVGIYLTGCSCMQSRDPEMFQRAYDLNLVQTLGAMQRVLANLPLPSNILKACVKYIRLCDVAESAMFQNVGFLTAGDYGAFLTLAQNVGARSEALGWLRALYPEIGMLADPGSATDWDVVQAFANANRKIVGTNENYVPYCAINGASAEPAALASGGILQCNSFGSSNHQLTSWIVPGTGNAGVGAQLHPYSSMCVYKASAKVDALLTRQTASGSYSNTAGVLTSETLQNSVLAVNIGHEYNLNADNTTPAQSTVAYTAASGVSTTTDTLTNEDTRYRVSSGFALSSLSTRLDANVLSVLYSMLE